jgi:hypothetical protein
MWQRAAWALLLLRLLLWPSPLLLWPSALLLQVGGLQQEPLQVQVMHWGVLLQRLQSLAHTLLMCWASRCAGGACARASQRGLSWAPVC